MVFQAHSFSLIMHIVIFIGETNSQETFKSELSNNGTTVDWGQPQVQENDIQTLILTMQANQDKLAQLDQSEKQI